MAEAEAEVTRPSRRRALSPGPQVTPAPVTFS